MMIKTKAPLLRLLSAALAVMTLSALAAPADMSPEAVAERIKPVGSVHLAGAQAAAPVASGPMTGEQVYGKFCIACHGTGALGAPKFGNADDWGPRKAKGADTLHTHALNGFNQMPARGTCVTCSDDEVKAAVDYMLSKI